MCGWRLEVEDEERRERVCAVNLGPSDILEGVVVKFFI